MREPPTVGPAQPEEQAAALNLAFQHLPPGDRRTRVANALRFLRQGELNPQGLLVARTGDRLLGVMICHPAPGASGLVWPPQAAGPEGHAAVEDLLVGSATGWLRQQGAKLAQALLAPQEAGLAVPLERNGFAHTTSLWYMRHDLRGINVARDVRDSLTYRTYDQDDTVAAFQTTLLRTYDDTLDCPEVNGVRTLDVVLEGHQAQGNYRPERWWLALDHERPVGVLLLTELPDLDGWDVSYVGVVPEARGRGFGRALLHKAMCEAHSGGAAQLMLSVDRRNRPAWSLYSDLGFEAGEPREVYLAVWNKPAESADGVTTNDGQGSPASAKAQRARNEDSGAADSRPSD
jgi:ribosomal protein S18 acetylase RimI-like enzyme